MRRRYHIVGNGGNPYRAHVVTAANETANENASGRGMTSIDVTLPNATHAMHLSAVLRVWVGTSPLNTMTRFSGGHGNQFDGNSLLVHVRNNVHVFFGANVYAFEPIAPIRAFVSPVGNSGVSYPYAIDTDDNFYLLTKHAVLTGDDARSKLIAGPNDDGTNCDPYNYFFERSLLSITENVTSDEVIGRTWGSGWEQRQELVARFKYAETRVTDGEEQHDGAGWWIPFAQSNLSLEEAWINLTHSRSVVLRRHRHRAQPLQVQIQVQVHVQNQVQEQWQWGPFTFEQYTCMQTEHGARWEFTPMHIVCNLQTNNQRFLDNVSTQQWAHFESDVYMHACMEVVEEAEVG
jgi:hypothetical protein